MKKHDLNAVGDSAHDLAQDLKEDLAHLGADARRLATDYIAPRTRDLADYVTPIIREAATNVADYVQPRAKDLSERGVQFACDARETLQPKIEKLAADVPPRVARLASETLDTLQPYLDESRERLQPRLEDARERLQPDRAAHAVPHQVAVDGVVEAPLPLQLDGLGQVMEEEPHEHQVPVERGIQRQHELRELQELEGVLQEAADPGMVDADGGRGLLEAADQRVVPQVLLRQGHHPGVPHGAEDAAELREHPFDVLAGGGQEAAVADVGRCV